ncbi:MAG: dicarboxylate/amino acid:cation symporter [Gemmatimonadota bacterium]|nr:dicarboxylate/amino acid:cation symporter [Gemmatimonadota bacterium]MDH5196034.1 dicarboxylate/amino acid:cation symporter [Gemmatimonadota bacterium]
MKLHTKILVGLAAGAAAGVAAHAFARDTAWVRFLADNVANPVGQVFLRMLLMTVVPLVFASITLGVAGIGDIRRVGRIGGKTLAYFLVSTAAAAVIGLVLVNTFRPGDGMDPAVRQQLFESYRSQAEGLQARMQTAFGMDMLLAIVPRNPIQAAANMDMLAVIFFAIVFGAALTLIPRERAAPMVRVLEALGDVVIKIIDFAMKLAPYGVFGLIFVVTSRFGWELLGQLGKYVLVVLVGLTLHGVIVLSALVRGVGGMRPLLFWKKARPVIVTAFSTSSSNATLPTNISVAEKDLGIPPHVAGFVLPLGATMNMNGTALYEGVTVLFLAQVFGVGLGLGQQLIVLLLSVVMAIGAAGVPGGSLPLIMVVLATVGVPPEAIAIILGVDRLLDMSRTVLNVTGDLSASVVIARSEGLGTAVALDDPPEPVAPRRAA